MLDFNTRQFQFMISGERKLCTIYQPIDDGPFPFSVVADGLPGPGIAKEIAKSLARSGVLSCTYPHRGTDSALGIFTPTLALTDYCSLVQFFQLSNHSLNIDRTKACLAGHSFGGFIALIATTFFPKTPVISVSPFNFGNDGYKEWLGSEHELFDGIRADPNSMNEFFEHNNEWNLLSLVDKFAEQKNSILLIAGEKDDVVLVKDNHEPLRNSLITARVEATTQIIDGAGHFFDESKKVKTQLHKIIYQWAADTILVD